LFIVKACGLPHYIVDDFINIFSDRMNLKREFSAIFVLSNKAAYEAI